MGYKKINELFPYKNADCNFVEIYYDLVGFVHRKLIM